jgi:hypothetical protein
VSNRYNFVSLKTNYPVAFLVYVGLGAVGEREHLGQYIPEMLSYASHNLLKI